MAIQERNQELVNLLSADFLRNKLPFAVAGTVGHYAELEFSGIDSTTPQLLVPNGPGDVTALIYFTIIVKEAGGGSAAAQGAIPGTVLTIENIYNIGGNSLLLYSLGDGSIAVVPVVGTYDLSISLRWI